MKTRQAKTVALAVPLALILAGVGCDLITRATADHVMIGSILASPPVTFSPATVAGIDAGSGVDAGTVTVPGQTAGYVFFGERNGDLTPEGLPGAAVTVGPAGGTKHTLDDSGGGSYAKTSVGDASFTYTPGTSYEFTSTASGTQYVGSVENSPDLEQIAAFHPGAGYVPHAQNQPFTFQRPALAAGAERNLGFVTVFPISDSGERGAPTYSNIPATPLAFLQMVAAPGPWRTDSVEVPATAFPTAQTTYVIVFQSVRMGTAKTNNLFVGSALLAGSGDIGVLRAF